MTPADPKNLTVKERFELAFAGTPVRRSIWGPPDCYVYWNGLEFCLKANGDHRLEGCIGEMNDPGVIFEIYTPPLPALVQVEGCNPAIVATEGIPGGRTAVMASYNPSSAWAIRATHYEPCIAHHAFNAVAHVINNSEIGQKIVALMEGE